jgi:hypothetical protein
VPPPKVKVPPARAELPVLVTVTVRALLVVPVAQFPNASGFGVTVARCVAATPVPLSETGEPVTVTFPAMVAVPVTVPGGAVAVNVTVMVQVAPAARVVPQVPPALENGDVTATVMPVRLAPPVLESVSVCAALVVPSTTLLKASAVGETLATAIFGIWYSTAPTSIELPLSGLGFP